MTDKWIDKLSDYLDDEMSPAERALLEARLAEDQELANTLGGLRRVKIHGQAVDDQMPPHAQSIGDGVARRIGATRSAPRDQGPVVGLIPWRSRRVPITVPQLIAASVALIVLSGGGAMVIQRFVAEPDAMGLPLTSAV
jgi:anti-sigma factor RsiW